MKKICIHCESEFDLNSKAKMMAGGKINECPDCVEEMGGDSSPPKYLGLPSSDGKMANLTIVAFAKESDRESYRKDYRNNAGYNKGKSCQLGTHLSAMGSGRKFKIVGENIANANHKGKA